MPSSALSRRRLFQAVALTAAYAPASEAAAETIPLDTIRDISSSNGVPLSDERLRVLKPVLEHRLPRMRLLRDFEVDDSIAPTQGISSK